MKCEWNGQLIKTWDTEKVTAIFPAKVSDQNGEVHDVSTERLGNHKLSDRTLVKEKRISCDLFFSKCFSA